MNFRNWAVAPIILILAGVVRGQDQTPLVAAGKTPATRVLRKAYPCISATSRQHDAEEFIYPVK
jgi:hypothetical protein